LVFLFVSLAVPYFDAELDATRIYQIMLIFLAPFLAIGFIEIGEFAGVTMSSVTRKLRLGSSALMNPSRLTRLLAIYLVVFMLFSTGFIYALTEGYQTIALDNQIDDMQFNHQEIVAATWQVNNSDGRAIYGDVFKTQLIEALGGQGVNLPYPQNASDFYIYLGTYNIEHNQAQISNFSGVNRNDYYSNVTPFVTNMSLIYSNGGADVYS
jgi:uncharacterized membrane protein